jgi:hypothetical protein
MTRARVRVRRHNNITFYISDEKIAVATPLQFFLIRPKTQYDIAQYNQVRIRILNRRIKNFYDICGYKDIVLLYSKMDYFDVT